MNLVLIVLAHHIEPNKIQQRKGGAHATSKILCSAISRAAVSVLHMYSSPRPGSSLSPDETSAHPPPEGINPLIRLNKFSNSSALW
jgi:hypothetical protein